MECTLCPHHCHIAEGKTGVCRSRRNHDGVLVSEVYGKPCAMAVDPVEKKPLYHFLRLPSSFMMLIIGSLWRRPVA